MGGILGRESITGLEMLFMKRRVTLTLRSLRYVLLLFTLMINYLHAG